MMSRGNYWRLNQNNWKTQHEIVNKDVYKAYSRLANVYDNSTTTPGKKEQRKFNNNNNNNNNVKQLAACAAFQRSFTAQQFAGLWLHGLMVIPNTSFF